MWRASTRVLQITACLMAMVAFLFVRASVVEFDSGDRGFQASGEILHVCVSSENGDILEEKPDDTAHTNSCDPNFENLRFVDRIASLEPSHWKAEQSDPVPEKVPIWLSNRALLI